jgi:NADPH:quinone reductase-like Zn-dependent oxidoreductase
MKAIIHHKYDTPKRALTLKEVDKPLPKSNEVLIHVKASSINSWDWDLTRGIPRIYRLLFGIFKPKNPIIGIDISGIVEAIGEDVKTLKVGDEVFGDVSASGFGAFAEYVCTTENLLAHKPKNASFAQASCLPHGGVLALQGVNFNGSLKPGQEVLINGAGGATGPFAIQMAKKAGAVVTCVDSLDKFDFLESLGADHLIDYKKANYSKLGKQYDLIIDLVAHHSLFDYQKVVKPKGAFSMVGGAVPKMIQVAILGGLVGRFNNKKLGILAHNPCSENLIELKKMFEEGTISANIDSTLPLEKVPEAIQKLGEGKTIGKVVIYP